MPHPAPPPPPQIETRGEPAPLPSPLPYIASSASLSPTPAPARPASGFVYPAGYGQIPHFRTPILTGNAPALLPAFTPAPPNLPDPALQIAMAKPPRRVLTAGAPIDPAAIAATTRVIPAPRPGPLRRDASCLRKCLAIADPRARPQGQPHRN